MRVTIVGGGILGTTHALEAVGRGHEVVQLEREAEARVATAAAKIAGGHGAVTETVTRGIRQALGAAAADPDVATTLRAGRLIREPEAPSIDQLLGSLPHPPAGAS